jgi:predicted DNA-binding helix-hairpin-helix protein
MVRRGNRLFKRKKWRSLTVAAGYDRIKVPIFEAAGKGCKIPLLKTLMSSHCSNDCKFCAFRAERKLHRDRWEPTELANVAFKAWERRQISGVFLSSSVERDPNTMVEQQIEAARLLRNKGFTDYIHLKLMPGTNIDLIKQSVQLADRVGINVEFPSASHYNNMKIFLNFRQDVMKRLRLLAHEITKAKKEGKCKAGLDSQMVVGASDETDKEILKVVDMMYNKMGAHRVYFSAFSPVRHTPLESKPAEDNWREYRLYQSSFLIQKYGFKRRDFVLDARDMLSLKYDPKYVFAAKNEISINVNIADFNDLIKIPGVGIETANRILETRALGARFKSMKELKNIGVILKRAQPFIEMDSRQTRLGNFTTN